MAEAASLEVRERIMAYGRANASGQWLAERSKNGEVEA